MQLNLVFVSAPDQPEPPEPAATTAVAVSPWEKSPWEKLDPTVQVDALQILARIIAAMLAAVPTPENSHE